MMRQIGVEGGVVFKVAVTVEYGPDYTTHYTGDLRANTSSTVFYGPYATKAIAANVGSREVNYLNTRRFDDEDAVASYEVVPGHITWLPTSGSAVPGE